jgi:hypothetical protein
MGSEQVTDKASLRMLTAERNKYHIEALIT